MVGGGGIFSFSALILEADPLFALYGAAILYTVGLNRDGVHGYSSLGASLCGCLNGNTFDDFFLLLISSAPIWIKLRCSTVSNRPVQKVNCFCETLGKWVWRYCLTKHKSVGI